MDKKTQKAHIYEVCIDQKCSQKQRLMTKLQDAFMHWGHTKLQFTTIHEQMLIQENSKRFQNMPIAEDLIIFSRDLMNELLKTISDLIKIKQEYLEKKILKMRDDNRQTKHLYMELNKDLKDINYDNIRQYTEEWDRILDPSRDSSNLLNYKKQIQISIDKLRNELIEVFEDYQVKQESQLETVKLQLVQYQKDDLDQSLNSTTLADDQDIHISKKIILDQNGESKFKFQFSEPKSGELKAQIGIIKQQIKQSENDKKVMKNARTKKLLEIQTGEQVSSVAISKDFIASSNSDGIVQLWSMKDGKHVHDFEGHRCGKNISGLKFTKNGEKLISASDDNSIRVWDIENKQIYWEIKDHTNKVQDIAFNPKNDEQFISASLDNTIKIWDIEIQQQGGEFTDGHQIGVKSICYSDDGELLVSGGVDKTITIWNANYQTKQVTFDSRHTSAIRGLLITKDRSRLITTGDSTIKIWNLINYGCKYEYEYKFLIAIMTFQAHPDYYIQKICFLNEENILVSASTDGTVKFWDISQNNFVLIGEPEKHNGGIILTQINLKEIWGLTKSEDETKIVIGCNDERVILFDTSKFLKQTNRNSEAYILKSDGMFSSPVLQNPINSYLKITQDSEFELFYSKPKKFLRLQFQSNNQKKYYNHKIIQESDDELQLEIQGNMKKVQII